MIEVNRSGIYLPCTFQFQVLFIELPPYEDSFYYSILLSSNWCYKNKLQREMSSGKQIVSYLPVRICFITVFYHHQTGVTKKKKKKKNLQREMSSSKQIVSYLPVRIWGLYWYCDFAFWPGKIGLLVEILFLEHPICL